MANHAYFVTTNTLDRAHLFRTEQTCSIVIQNLEFYERRGDFELHGYVVMPDHVHLLIQPHTSTISDVMRNLKSYVAKEFRDRGLCQGQMWQVSFHDRVVRGEKDYLAMLEYIHLNPVKAGMCARAEDYPYSSAASYGIGGR